MNARFGIEPLDAAHRRKTFTCGVLALDRYLHELATQDVRRRISNCFVARDSDGAIAGYYTFAAASIPLSDVSSDISKRLPRYAALPAGLIGRLAVDQRFQGRGLGGALVMDAVGRAARGDAAIFALIVDAKDEAAVGSYVRLGFVRFANRPQSLYLPMATARQALACGV